MANKIVRADGTTLEGVKTVVYNARLNSGTDLRAGCVSSASIECDVLGEQEDAVEAGEELKYYKIDSKGNETLVGRFYAEPTIRTRNTYHIVAYDSVSKLDVDFSSRLAELQDSFPMTLAELVAEACAVAGVRLEGAVGNFTDDGYGNVTMHDESVNASDDGESNVTFPTGYEIADDENGNVRIYGN